MSNKKLFHSEQKMKTTTATKRNNAGGNAFDLGAEHELAQYALTSTFNGSAYTSGTVDLEKIKTLSKDVSDMYLAQLAVYSRSNGFMKDTPVALLAVLQGRNQELFKKVFGKVINNGKMLKNFVQMIRSGQFGRKSFGTSLKNTINKWINGRSDEQLLKDSIGNDPSLADVLKMVHTRPKNDAQSLMFAYLTGKLHFSINSKTGKIQCHKKYVKNGIEVSTKVNASLVPDCVKNYERYKLLGEGSFPKVPFQMLTSLNLGTKEWSNIAKDAQWQMTRMNLNTFARNGVLKDSNMVDMIANRLSDYDNVRKSMNFPYQIYTAYNNIGSDVPSKIKNSLKKAVEYSLENIPRFDEDIVVCIDISYSMSGTIGNGHSSTRYIDAAALFAAAVKKTNPNTRVILFNTSGSEVTFRDNEDVFTIATKIANKLNGGTDCGSAIQYLNSRGIKSDTVVMFSDNESWAGMSDRYGWGRTSMKSEWKEFTKSNKNAKLINIDIAPNSSFQVPNVKNSINIGGFSDNVFTIMDMFIRNSNNSLVSDIKSITL